MQSTIVRDCPSVRVLGSRVHLPDLDQALCVIQEWIEQRGPRCRQIIVTGYHGLWEAHKDPTFHKILNSADLWVPDGIAPVLVAKMRGIRQARRIPGAELMEAFLAKADFLNYRSFFYGDTPETLAALKLAAEEKYPGHVVAGTFSPPFRPVSAEEDEQHVRMINESRPDVLWVGLGLPKQDRWIYERLDHLEVPVAIGVGAAFGFLSGEVRRAPAWMGKVGLEWAYRLMREPRKCWRRCVVEGPQFIAHVAMELTGIRKY